MARINETLANSIHLSLVENLKENYTKYYCLAYSLVKNQDVASDIVANAAYFSLYNGRKLKGLPPMHIWFLQLIIKDAMRHMHKCNFPVDFNKDSQLYAFMDTLDPSATNAFKLFYFEELDTEKVAEILRYSPAEVKSKVSFVRSELKIDSSLDQESMEKIHQLLSVYHSPPTPENLWEKIADSIEKEEANFAQYVIKARRDRILKPIGVVILAGGIFILTVLMGRQNPTFAQSILAVPFMSSIFAPFL